MNLSDSILATLAYHDIFDYPLTAEEVQRYLIDKKASLKSISSSLVILERSDRILNKDNLYTLKKRNNLFTLRKQRVKYSQSKLKRAQLFSYPLSLIPTIKLVAISGALAMQNSCKNDDIDLFLITAKNTLWTTRLFTNLLLLPFKRHPKSVKTTDRACLNTFLDESNLKISPSNLYLAHEICQMKPIWDRGNTYHQFLKANRWVTKFLPNWTPNDERQTTNDKRQKESNALVLKRLALVARPLEVLAKWGQLWYMHSKITSEKIGEHQLFFHPQDTQTWVLKEYQKRLKRLRIQLN